MNTNLLEIKAISHKYPGPQGWFQVLDGIQFSLRHGEILGIAGESGAGKSTLIKIIAGLEAPYAGEIYFDGRPIPYRSRSQLRDYFRQIGMVFQHPRDSFNPRWPLFQSIAEPLVLREIQPHEVNHRVEEIVSQVGLPLPLLEAFPHQLSGGQLQRAAIARALIGNPRLLLLDEPTAALDVSIQAQILNLLARLQHYYRFSMIIVSHDLAVLQWLCHTLLILRNGKVVEKGAVEEIVRYPKTEYTKQLIKAVLM